MRNMFHLNTFAMNTFSPVKPLTDSIREKFRAGRITLHDAAIKFHEAGFDNFVDMEATRKRLG